MTAVPAVSALRGEVRLPSSKPHGQRAVLLAALADGESRLLGLDVCSETATVRHGCAQLGARFGGDRDEMLVHGRGTRSRAPAGVLRVGGSGFALRSLLALSCLGPGPAVFAGLPGLGRRPLAPLLAALDSLGGRIEPLTEDGLLPLVSWGGGLTAPAETVAVPTAETSQFATALLLAGPYVAGGLRLDLLPPVGGGHYLRMTVGMMRLFGADVVTAGDRIEVRPGRYRGRTVRIGPDVTSLFSFLAAAVLVDTDVVVPGVRPGGDPFIDAALELGRRLGVRVEPAGAGIRIASGPPPDRRVTVDAAELPTLVPALAAVAPALPAGMRLSGAAHLQHHKTSRLGVVIAELAKLGRRLEPVFTGGRLDGFVTAGATGPAEPTGQPLDSHGDHRLYVALHLAAMTAVRPPELTGEETLSASFPGFPAAIAQLAGLAVRA